MMKLRAILTMSVLAVIVTFISYWMAQQSYTWFPPQAAAEAKIFDDLFALFTGLGTFIFLGVAIPLFYSLIFHRAGKYDESDGPPIEGNTWLEVIWTAVPILLVASLVTASANAYRDMNIQGPSHLVHLHMPSLMESAYAAPAKEGDEPIERIDVTAKQWAWIFHYPDQNVTSTELHLPVDRRVRLTLRSEDVLHGFYVPAFRLKQDVVPNHDIDLELKPIRQGTYRLRDSMFSGTYFAANQADVVVQSPEDYQQWLAAAADQPLTQAYNPAAAEYHQSNDDKIVRGWKSIEPAPPPMVNYAPKYQPNGSSVPTSES